MPDGLWELIEPLLPRTSRRFRYPGRKRIGAFRNTHPQDQSQAAIGYELVAEEPPEVTAISCMRCEPASRFITSLMAQKPYAIERSPPKIIRVSAIMPSLLWESRKPLIKACFLALTGPYPQRTSYLVAKNQAVRNNPTGATHRKALIL